VFDLHFHRELVLALRMRTARRRARALVQHSGRDEKGWLLVQGRALTFVLYFELQMEQVSTFIPRIYLLLNRYCIRRYAIHARHGSGYLQRLVAKEEKEIESSRKFYISSLSAFRPRPCARHGINIH
jgi:hypothetical protein